MDTREPTGSLIGIPITKLRILRLLVFRELNEIESGNVHTSSTNTDDYHWLYSKLTDEIRKAQ